jgi:hypothetical protein
MPASLENQGPPGHALPHERLFEAMDSDSGLQLKYRQKDGFSNARFCTWRIFMHFSKTTFAALGATHR